MIIQLIFLLNMYIINYNKLLQMYKLFRDEKDDKVKYNS